MMERAKWIERQRSLKKKALDPAFSTRQGVFKGEDVTDDVAAAGLVRKRKADSAKARSRRKAKAEGGVQKQDAEGVAGPGSPLQVDG